MGFAMLTMNKVEAEQLFAKDANRLAGLKVSLHDALMMASNASNRSNATNASNRSNATNASNRSNATNASNRSNASKAKNASKNATNASNRSNASNAKNASKNATKLFEEDAADLIKISISKKGVKKLQADENQINRAVDHYYLHPRVSGTVDRDAQSLLKSKQFKELTEAIIKSK